ncbi:MULTISPECIES: sigma-70 family RNA polymerase sigma factor [unclassified Paenibacillus]|uniref:sigma-70 family RNA polymerase sigma factor n=1 Tax=unclassified Paenibacillus TaxID=185978 RepID=UPI00034E3ACF|nr:MULTISPECIES: sigma-70 family RNA polymerase sigma factor [unclassified Paenibacillus]EPD92549.1 SigM family RNA polymerase sigma factor [Paenibacillus sp. HGH0039]
MNESLSLEDIYRKYFKDLYAYLFSLCKDHHLTEDILQETFYRAYVNLEDYSGPRIKSWLFTVAKNTYIDYLRKHKRMDLKQDEFFAQVPVKGSTEQTFLEKEGKEKIVQAVSSLPDKYRDAVRLCDVEEMSCQAAADVLNLKLSTLKSLLFRGRQKLRQMKRKESEPGHEPPGSV